VSVRAAALRQRLNRELGTHAEPLKVLVAEATRAKARVLLVGGPVRDLLLGLPVLDIDLLVSDQLERVARTAAEKLGAELVVRPRFLTATLRGPDYSFDLASARSESYAQPGALPEVAPTDLADDLRRRDFTVNSMALPLGSRSGQTLIDPMGGLRDLERRQLRTLHDASFRDDPTRLFRAARYAARLRFRLAAPTARLARAAVEGGALESISGDRITHEIERMLDETEIERALIATQRLELLAAIEPGWSLDAEFRRGLRRLARAAAVPAWPGVGESALRRACGFRLLLAGVSPRARGRVLERLAIRGRPAASIEDDLRELRSLCRSLARPISPGRLDARLARLPDSLLLLAHCMGRSPVPQNIARYANRLRDRPDPLSGNDARELGLNGPVIGELVRAARERSLDGRSVDPSWLRRWLARRVEMS
jgi:tRNA nucleotidyltransferase (CCA-adding enzyme)